MSGPLRLGLRHETGFDVVTPAGELRMGTAPALRRMLCTALSGTGRVVADLRNMTLDAPPAGLVFSAALAQAGGWPRARLTVAGPAEQVRLALAEQGVSDLVPTCQSLPGAVRALDIRPTVVRRRIWLDLDAGVVMRAQMFVELSCQDWGLAERYHLDGVTRVSTMLVRAGDIRVDGNAAATVSLSVELGPHGLGIAVRVWPGSTTPSRIELKQDGQIGLTRHLDGFTYSTLVPDSGLDHH